MKYGSFLLTIFFGALLFGSFVFEPSSVLAQSSLTEQQRAELQRELAQVEAEQKQAAIELTNAQNKSASLARDISVLDAKIRSAQLAIKAKNILIQSLGNDISKKVTLINDLEDRIEKGRDTLSQILRKTNEVGELSIPELVLSTDTVTELVNDLDKFESVQESLRETFEQLKSNKASTTAEKEALDNRRNAELDARYEIQQQQKNIESNQAEKRQLLTLSKGAEKSYTKLIADKQARAAQIRSALFALRDAAAIPFGEALQYATLASQKTGVRPAFILAIIKQESNLGSNVGACVVTDLNSGNGIKKSNGTFVERVMKSPRDTDPFRTITAELGRQWSETVVSCPIGSTKYYLGRGFGGAMGPAQFIPSTWILVKDKTVQFLGNNSTPDPWNPAHAIMASGVYLSELGANANSYTSEIRAACKYYGSGGSSCTYGKQVMALVDNIQRTMIDPLQGL